MPGHNVGRGMESRGKSKKSKAPKGGPRGRGLRATRKFKDTEEGKAAIERGLRRSLAGEGESDVSKYDDRLAAAIRDVDFRNSPIGRSLLADQFKRGDISATAFDNALRNLQNPVEREKRSLAEIRQVNQLLGLNPTAGMGILDSLRSGAQGEQFKQEKRRLRNLATLSPVRQAIASLFGRRTDDFPTTDQVFGVSAEEDARLRLLSNPDLQNFQFNEFLDNLDDFGDVAPEQVVTDPIIDIPTTQVEEQPNISQVDLSGIVGPAIGAGILGAAAAPRIFSGPPKSVRFKPTVRGIPGVVGSGSAVRSGPPKATRFPGTSIKLPAAGTGVLASEAAKRSGLSRFASMLPALGARTAAKSMLGPVGAALLVPDLAYTGLSAFAPEFTQQFIDEPLAEFGQGFANMGDTMGQAYAVDPSQINSSELIKASILNN